MTSILVIEDERTIRENIAELLEYEGYTVLTAENGVEGVASARSTLPNLILCDIMMPVMDGYGVLATLRLQPATRSIPFIFLTAKTDWKSVRQGMELGADDYLVKPHSSAELLEAVSMRFEKHDSMQHLQQQRLDELRGNLIRMLPHELRTPLFGILGNAQMLCLDAETLERQEIQQMAAGIVTAGERLQHVIENYLLYAQTELTRTNRMQMVAVAQHREALPGALIRDAVGAKAHQFKRENDVLIQAEDVEICIAAENLWKIVEELVDNALKFSVAGSAIQITGRRERDSYLFQVRDQGRGMTPEQIQQIGVFMQFERDLHEQQGVGIGLTLAQRLVQLYGGTLQITSELGGGTTVSVEFLLTPGTLT
jgi:two-component system, sensor histidine kinase and response regulator